MSDELITPENLSKEYLKSVLDAAFMETSYDKDGDLKVKDKVNCFVLMNQERKDRVQLMSIFGFKPGTSELERLRAVNRINAEYVIIRATVGKNDCLIFTWDLPITGGLPKKTFVLALKRFCGIPHDAVAACAQNEVE